MYSLPRDEEKARIVALITEREKCPKLLLVVTGMPALKDASSIAITRPSGMQTGLRRDLIHFGTRTGCFQGSTIYEFGIYLRGLNNLLDALRHSELQLATD